MSKLKFLIFILILGCVSNNKVYICGNHECKNQREIDEYFKNNISIEVYVIEDNNDKKNKDLVQLNSLNENINNKEENNKNLSFLKERKTQDVMNKKEQKPKKMKLTVKTEISESLDKSKNVKKQEIQKEEFTYKKQKTKKIVHMCKNLDECDIDVISRKVSELGINKSYPDIN